MELLFIRSKAGDDMKKTVIYGAQAIALGTYEAIKIINPERSIDCFLVSQMDGNPPFVSGIKVELLLDYLNSISGKDKDDIEVLICTPEDLMQEIVGELEKVELFKYKKVDSRCFAELQEKAFAVTKEFFSIRSFYKGNAKPVVKIYKMIHEKDRKLSSEIQLNVGTIDLQVGAALSNKRMAELADDMGNNISRKNPYYSELTGLYWIWKNELIHIDSGEAYYGLAHYRRFLDLSDEDVYRLLNNQIDVVLPYPLPYEPNMESHHRRYLSKQEWKSTISAIEELYPEKVQDYRRVLSQRYLFNYNIILAKREVLNDYCEWLFPILSRVETINALSGEENNRYIGYIAETLETMYFMSKKNELKIACCGVRFIA